MVMDDMRQKIPQQSLNSFQERRRHMHEVYKLYKLGILKEEELTDEERRILIEYYGVEVK